jgi:quercetin dioxygenase-like cupin family protein
LCGALGFHAALEAVYPGKADEVEVIDFFGRDEALAHLCFACAEMLSARVPDKSDRVAGGSRGSVPRKAGKNDRSLSVTFEPGARTAWHTHPLSQTLIVTAGCGLAQGWGGPIQQIRPGDVIWFPSGEKHWHGATATTAMTHIAIVERLDGKSADWMEKHLSKNIRWIGHT